MSYILKSPIKHKPFKEKYQNYTWLRKRKEKQEMKIIIRDYYMYSLAKKCENLEGSDCFIVSNYQSWNEERGNSNRL